MQNVTFRCGHCNNLMAVTPLDVGKQVRCPHCQQVVVAPAPPAPVPAVAAVSTPAPVPPPPASQPEPFTPSFEMPMPTEHESIFNSASASDDLFGAEPAPQIEMPSEPAPNMSLERATASVHNEMTAVQAVEEPAPLPDAIPASAADEVFQHVASEPALPWHTNAEPHTEGHADTSSAPVEQESLSTPVVRRQTSGMGGWSIPLLFALISYSILATIFALMAWKENRRLNYEFPHPLENVPDIEGDNPGVRNGSRSQLEYPNPEMDLPANLKMKLGEKRTVGAIEFTPLKVTKERIWIETKGFNAEQEEKPSLVLHFKVRNVSDNQTFAPLDAFFYRRSPAQDRSLDKVDPYTMLVIGDSKLIGGPAEYTRKGSKQPRESVRGQNLAKTLAPGEEMTSFVCTDPRKGDLNRLIGRVKNDMLWRVQVRRGLVDFESPLKGKRSVPATVILGVTFGLNDVDKT